VARVGGEQDLATKSDDGFGITPRLVYPLPPIHRTHRPGSVSPQLESDPIESLPGGF
jgi:hypothetical protein